MLFGLPKEPGNFVSTTYPGIKQYYTWKTSNQTKIVQKRWFVGFDWKLAKFRVFAFLQTFQNSIEKAEKNKVSLFVPNCLILAVIEQ